MSRRSLRVTVLAHPELIPPDDVSGIAEETVNEYKTEYDVITALRELGHEVATLGLSDELRPLRLHQSEYKPHIVFNLLEELRGEPRYDMYVVAYMEVRGLKYTGNSPRGLMLARDKALSKKVLAYHRVRSPRFLAIPRDRRIPNLNRLTFPVIVKSMNEDASVGISQASVVEDEPKARERVEYLHEQVGTDVIVEEFIAGREIYVGVLGNKRLNVFEPIELVFEKEPPGRKIATEKAKFDLAYQRRWGIDIKLAEGIPDATLAELKRVSRRIYKALDLRGYARIDFRLDRQGRLFFLEANPNPDIARYEEFATAAEQAGFGYEELIAKIVALGLRR